MHGVGQARGVGLAVALGNSHVVVGLRVLLLAGLLPTWGHPWAGLDDNLDGAGRDFPNVVGPGIAERTPTSLAVLADESNIAAGQRFALERDSALDAAQA